MMLHTSGVQVVSKEKSNSLFENEVSFVKGCGRFWAGTVKFVKLSYGLPGKIPKSLRGVSLGLVDVLGGA